MSAVAIVVTGKSEMQQTTNNTRYSAGSRNHDYPSPSEEQTQPKPKHTTHYTDTVTILKE